MRLEHSQMLQFLDKYSLVFDSWIHITSSAPRLENAAVAPQRTLLEYSPVKAKDFIKQYILPRGLGFSLAQLWSCIALVFKVEVSIKKDEFSHYYSTIKNQLKNRMQTIRTAMYTDKRNILSEEDTQFKKLEDHLKALHLEQILEDHDVIAITSEEVNKIWNIKFLNLDYNTTGHEIYVSILCALDDKEFEEVFSDNTRKFLAQLDLILKADPLHESVKRAFTLDAATLDILTRNGC